MSEFQPGDYGVCRVSDWRGCRCTGYRPASTPQPEPTGLVERVVEQITDNGHASIIEDRAAAAALVVAAWLDECVHDGYRRAAKRIRREVEGSGT